MKHTLSPCLKTTVKSFWTEKKCEHHKKYDIIICENKLECYLMKTIELVEKMANYNLYYLPTTNKTLFPAMPSG